MEHAYQKFLSDMHIGHEVHIRSTYSTCVSGMYLGHDYWIRTPYMHYMHFRCTCQKWISERHDRYEHRCISILAWHGKYDYPMCISEMHAQNAFARCMPDIHIGFVYQITYWLLISDRHIRSQTHMPIKDMLEAGLAWPSQKEMD